MKILVVDDDKEIAQLLEIYIKNEGYEPISAYNGREALTKLNTNPDIALMILDIMMPEMNGYEAVKVIRAMNDRPDGKNIPIIAMTANSFAEDVQASLDAGMNAHLSKPIVIDEVIKTILRYVYN